MSDKYENLGQITDGLIKENINLKKENQDQHAEIKEMKKQIKNEKQARNDSDQYMRREMVEINGFPQKKDENLQDLVRKMANDMKVPLANEDIDRSCSQTVDTRKGWNNRKICIETDC